MVWCVLVSWKFHKNTFWFKVVMHNICSDIRRDYVLIAQAKHLIPWVKCKYRRDILKDYNEMKGWSTCKYTLSERRLIKYCMILLKKWIGQILRWYISTPCLLHSSVLMFSFMCTLWISQFAYLPEISLYILNFTIFTHLA